MRYKEDNDNRYRVNFMRATEELMDAITVESFISYLEENAEYYFICTNTKRKNDYMGGH